MSNSPKAMTDALRDTFAVLVFRYLDDLLNDAEFEEFNCILLAYPESRSLFLAYSKERIVIKDILMSPYRPYQLKAIIEQMAEVERQAGDSGIVDLTKELERRHLRALESKRARSASRQPSGQKPTRNGMAPMLVGVLGTAALLGLVAWVVTLVAPTPNVPSSQQVGQTPIENPIPLVQPEPIFAVLQSSHRLIWNSSSLSIATGNPLDIGEYQIESGYIQVAMSDGTFLIVEGPASFEIQSGSRITLDEGILTAYVPEGAEGFIVDTPAGRVLDLGTEFGIEVLADDFVEVHVMQGQVVASLLGQEDSRMMRAGDAGRMDPSAARIEPVVSHSQKFARNWEQVERSVRVSDAVRYLFDTPESVAPSVLEDNAVLFLLPEKRGVEVPAYRVLCDFILPGRYDQLSNAIGAARGGAVVDSYLLHYDRVGTPGELVFVEGTIHFDHPIIGVIAGNQRLHDSDAMFAVADTAYPQPGFQGRGFEGNKYGAGVQDIVEISPDRRTLTVRLGTADAIDQLRVLVEAAPVDEPDQEPDQ